MADEMSVSAVLEAHDIFRGSMERQFEATHKTLDEGLDLLKQVALHTTGRVQALETRRSREQATRGPGHRRRRE